MHAIPFEKLSPQQKLEYTVRPLWEEMGQSHDNEVVQGPGWFQVITRSSSSILANGVFRCELKESEIDERIQKTISTYRSHGLPFHWTVAPTSRPSDLAQRLKTAGLHLGSVHVGFIADPAQIKIQPAPDVTIEAVSAENIEAWASIMKHGHLVPDHAINRLKAQVLHQLEAKRHWVTHFLAKHCGKAAGIIQNRYQNGYVYTLGGVVDPNFRKKGIFATLLHRVNADAVEKNFNVIVTHALKETSEEIFSKLGYEKTCELENYFWKPN
jgi:N-acetylglutamate synthase-like GNAT family acetyltransferase